MFSLFLAARNDLWRLWLSAPVARRFLYAAGLLLILSGFFHMGIYLDRGGGWEGPLSWRKPILFGFSGGLTTVSVGWGLSLVTAGTSFRKLPGKNLIEAFYCYSFTFAIVTEVALISAQTWRGVPSHFNEATSLDSGVFYLMGLLIIYVSAEIAVLTLVSFWPLAVAKDSALAVRGGLMLLLLGCVLGFWTLSYGVARAHVGLSPETYGAHGVMKFPHGLPIHGIQYLAFQSWLMRQRGVSEGWRVKLILSSIAGLIFVTLYGLIQTLSGHGRFDFNTETGLLLAVSVVLFALPFLAAVWPGLGRHDDAPKPA